MYYMSIVKKSTSWTMDEAHDKKLDMRKLIHNEVIFEVTFEGHPNYPKTYFMNIFRCFDDHQMPPQKLTSLCLNLMT